MYVYPLNSIYVALIILFFLFGLDRKFIIIFNQNELDVVGGNILP